jgi:hypothetical protein
MIPLKKLITLLIVLLLIATVKYGNAVSVNQTPWMSDSQFKMVFDNMKENRFMPFKIIGKYEQGQILYQGYFMPYPRTLDYYYCYWGMTTKWYNMRKQKFESVGMKEIWHQTFKDGVGTELQQAIWQILDKSVPEPSDETDERTRI